MTTLSGSFAAAGVSGQFILKPGESASYSVTGTFTGQVRLERSRKGRDTWENVETGAADTGISGTVKAEGAKDECFRFRALTLSAGSADYSLADASDVVQEFKGPDGQVLLRLKDDSIEIPSPITLESLYAATGMFGQFSTISDGESRVIPSGTQSIVFGELVISSGSLQVDGELRVADWPT